jgi:hypothetical protein
MTAQEVEAILGEHCFTQYLPELEDGSSISWEDVEGDGWVGVDFVNCRVVSAEWLEYPSDLRFPRNLRRWLGW